MNSIKPINLHLDWCNLSAAEYACKNWHYSKTVPRTKLLKIGVWENSVFIGCIIYSWGSTSNLVRPYGLTMTEGCELTRIALSNHQTPVSRMIAISLKFLKKKCPMLRLVVSFADPFHDHHGGIYQATNWIYTGMTEKSFIFKDKNGKEWHARNVGTDLNNPTTMVLRSECQRIERPPKHRYLMPLDNEIKTKISKLAKPYPKRCVSSIDSDAPESHSGEGGAHPTDTLHE